ncbi:MAG: hypothetical protein EGQ09_03000 [Clostridiales bacterium]|nr:hypothetical protein [Clostridiales bacterium]
MRIKGNSADWVDLTIYHSTLKTTVLNKFYDTLHGIYAAKASGISLEAGALCGGKLMLQVDYTLKDSDLIDSDLVQVDPDSFAVPAMNVVVGTGNWQDVTAPSDGRLLSVSSGDRTVFSLWEDGKWVATGNLEQSALGGSVLVGIASAGKDSSGAEALYGLTKDGALYSIPVTIDMSASAPLTLGEATLIHSNIIPDWYTTDSDDPTIPYTWSMDSASLLYNNAHGYLLAAATYYSMALDESQSKVYLIDPVAGTYVPMRVYDQGNDPDETSVFTSLYQYEQKKDAAGVQLYVDKDALTLKAGESMDLPAAEAYTFSTDENGLVTNSKVDADAVEWSSSNEKVATVENGVITGVAVGSTHIRAKASYQGNVDESIINVTVREDTGLAGATVGALVDTGIGNPSWGVIDLGLDDSGNLTFDEKGKADKDYTAGGYAQGKLWGFCNISSERKLYPFNAETFTASGDPFTTGKNNVRDLTGAPATAVLYTKDGSKQTVTDPASLLYVTSKADIGRLGLLGSNGSINAPYQYNEPLVSDYEGDDTLTLSSITYVGDLTAAQVREGTKKDLSNCDADTPCHVYYALTEDAKLRQLILVPQVDTDGTLSYTLCGKTIATVTGFPRDDDDYASTASMDLLQMTGKTYLLVARSSIFGGGSSLWKIDITNYAYDNNDNTNNTLEAKKIGGLGSTVQDVTALYHTGTDVIPDGHILAAAGWGDLPQFLTGAMLSASPRAANSDQPTISIPITGSTPYGKWTLNYAPDKLAFDFVDAVTDILYKAYSHDEKNHTVTLAYATLGGQDFDANKPVLKVNFTVKEGQSASDANVTKAQGEFNTIMVNSSDYGTVNAPDPASALVGSTVKLIAAPDEGYMLHGWKTTPSSVTIQSDNTFTMPGVSVTVEAIFAPFGSHSWEEGWSHDDTYHWHACTGCAEKDSLAAHDFQWTIDKAATTAETGLKHEECTVCGAVRSEGTVINKLSSGGGGGGSSAAPTYPVSTPSKAENGSVSISSKNAAKGTTVTITVKPNGAQLLPGGTCTRVQIVTFLWRAFDK